MNFNEVVPMKFYFLLLAACLLLQGCNKQEAPPIPYQPSEVKTDQGVVINRPNAESSRPAKPAEGGKTIAALYQLLKSKGLKIDDLKPVQIRYFSSEESASFKDERKIGYLLLRYENADAAKAIYPTINEVYSKKLGRALVSKNFVIAVFGVQRGFNKPEIIQLTDEEYKTIQNYLDEFVTS